MTSKITREVVVDFAANSGIHATMAPTIECTYQALEAFAKLAYSAGAASMKERAAKAVPTKRSAISLIAGEMNSSEWRLVSAILLYVQENITSLSDFEE